MANAWKKCLCLSQKYTIRSNQELWFNHIKFRIVWYLNDIYDINKYLFVIISLFKNKLATKINMVAKIQHGDQNPLYPNDMLLMWSKWENNGLCANMN